MMARSAILMAGRASLMTGGAVRMAGLNVVFYRLLFFLSFFSPLIVL
jgi:hypothetical protein